MLFLATRYGLDSPVFETRQGQGTMSSPKIFHTVSGSYPASSSMGTRDSFPGVKRQGRGFGHSPQPSAEVKKEWSYTSAPPICLHSLCRENFTFVFGFQRSRSFPVFVVLVLSIDSLPFASQTYLFHITNERFVKDVCLFHSYQ